METRIDEIADRIYRLSSFVPAVAPPHGLTFNQFLIDADEPLLFHCGQRQLFPLVSAAVARILDLKRIRWITFSHIEADECGSMNDWLAAAPQATAAHGRVGCNIWLTDQATRPPRALTDGEVMDLGGKRVRRIDTPHLPHCWDAGLLYEETTGTLFCSDLFTHTGNGPALTDGDIVGPSLALEKALRFMSVTPNTAPAIRRLAELSPRKVAIMHGSSFSGDAAAALEELARFYEEEIGKSA
ncbi:MAG: MBL fold metallo-hydrolase [Candidatus Binataceae bacterium]